MTNPRSFPDHSLYNLVPTASAIGQRHGSNRLLKKPVFPEIRLAGKTNKKEFLRKVKIIIKKNGFYQSARFSGADEKDRGSDNEIVACIASLEGGEEERAGEGRGRHVDVRYAACTLNIPNSND